MLRLKMLSSLVVCVLVVLPSLLGGAVSVAANNKACVEERILQAIDLLEGASLEADAVESVSESTRRAIDILFSIKDDLQQDRYRRLEEEADDQDDYFTKTTYATYNDVSVSYSGGYGNGTVVTVGEDVIVIIEHTMGYFLLNLMLCAVCIVLGALMSGLLMGVMTLDPLMLGVKARTADTEGERRRAMALTPFVQNKNLVLVSVVLVNAGVNEALPVFMERLLVDNTFLAIIISVSLVVLAGEIVPAAYFTGSDQIRSASRLIPLLRVVIVVTSPISYPLAKLIDKFFHEGDGRSSFKRGELTALVRIQHEEQLARKLRKQDALENKNEKRAPPKSSLGVCNILEPLDCILNEPEYYAFCAPVEGGGGNPHNEMNQEIDDDDITKMEGALSIKTKKVKQAYTPLNRVVAITSDAILDEAKIVELYSHGYSRIPVYKRHGDGNDDAQGICGVLLIKQLILVKKEEKRPVSTLPLYQPHAFSPETTIAAALNIFQAGKQGSSNMALVCVRPELANAALKRKKPVPSAAGVLGIITLENLLEELIQEQIYDEKDKKHNRSLERARWALAKWKVFTLRRRKLREEESNSSDGSDEAFNYVKMREIV
jgi:metal transporter CNNM